MEPQGQFGNPFLKRYKATGSLWDGLRKGRSNKLAEHFQRHQ